MKISQDKMKNKYAHIQLAINFSDLIRTTLGPRGMNKIVVKDNQALHTNDGATIVKNIDTQDPIIDLFKQLAISQEESIGDGTTTATILAGQFLSNALQLINKGIHPTTIINGYDIAKTEAIKFLNNHAEKGDKNKIIRTAFGSKLGTELINHLKDLILQIKDFENLKIFKKIDDPKKSEIFHGFIFEGFTINDQMKSEINGNICLLDYRTNVEAANFQITNSEELKKINLYDREYKREIINKLVEKKVDCLLYTDTNPEFEAMLAEKGITGIVVYNRGDFISGISQVLDIIPTSDPNNIHVKKGKLKYVKPNQIFIDGDMETLILCGSTQQILDEIERCIHDVISLLKHDIKCVIGAGAIEIEIANHLILLAKGLGGKEQLAIEKYAEAIESIPLILAENSGLDSIAILTSLRTKHLNGEKDLGVDIYQGVSDARERGIVDPVLVKIYAINSATNVANLIIKTDKILIGEPEKK